MLDFSTLYAEHARDVRRFALFLSGDPALADDITSETFIRAWGAQDRFDLASVRGYLLAIARNLHLHELRRVRARPRLDLDAVGAAELATYWVGQGVGLMNQMTSAAEVVQEFKRDYLEAAERLMATLEE